MEAESMNEQHYEEIKKRFSFDEWRNRNTLEENLFIWQFFFLGDEFPNWQLHKTRSLEAPPSEPKTVGTRMFAQEFFGHTPRVIQSVWQPAARQTGTIVSVDTYECASRAAAHELLIRTLGEFQSPLLRRQAENVAGDVAFTHPGSGIMLFARANHLIVIRSIGQVTVPVTELARQLDNDLIEKPPAPISRAEPTIRSLKAEAEELEVGSRVPLEIDVDRLPDRQLIYKFFSRDGEVLAEEGRLLYRPTNPGEQTFEFYAVGPSRGVATERIRFSVK
jgi:hypothetical protein